MLKNIVLGESLSVGKREAKDRLVKIDKEEFIKQMQVDFAATMKAVAGAANAAPDGRLINGSEEACREALGQFRLKGMKIGSGPTESSCKSEARRLKGIGMRWKQRNADGMLALEALHQSDLWQTYWKSQFKPAA